MPKYHALKTAIFLVAYEIRDCFHTFEVDIPKIPTLLERNRFLNFN